jgi:hypothetical protein
VEVTRDGLDLNLLVRGCCESLMLDALLLDRGTIDLTQDALDAGLLSGPRWPTDEEMGEIASVDLNVKMEL